MVKLLGICKWGGGGTLVGLVDNDPADVAHEIGPLVEHERVSVESAYMMSSRYEASPEGS